MTRRQVPIFALCRKGSVKSLTFRFKFLSNAIHRVFRITFTIEFYCFEISRKIYLNISCYNKSI